MSVEDLFASGGQVVVELVHVVGIVCIVGVDHNRLVAGKTLLLLRLNWLMMVLVYLLGLLLLLLNIRISIGLYLIIVVDGVILHLVNVGR